MRRTCVSYESMRFQKLFKRQRRNGGRNAVVLEDVGQERVDVVNTW